MPRELRAAGFLIFRRMSQQIEYLLLQTSYGEKHWTPPKGHVDPGEDDFTTALRETLEEAGYKKEDLDIFLNIKKILHYKVRNKNKVVVYWLAELLNPNNLPKLSNEHQDFRWLEKEEAKNLSGFQDFNEMLDYFHDKIVELK